MLSGVRLGIRAWLFVLVVVAILPVSLFSGYVVYELAHSQRAATTATLAQRTEASANAVAALLNNFSGGLKVLANSPAVEAGDVAALYAHAKRILPFYPDALAISLVTPDGRQVFNTFRPYGDPLPPSSDVPEFKTGMPGEHRLSPPFQGTVTGKMALTVGVPILLGGNALHVLRFGMPLDSLQRVLMQQRLPADWPMVLFDEDATTLARTRSPETTIGQKVTQNLVKRARSGDYGIATGKTREGIDVVSALYKVPDWDCWVATGVPIDTLDERVNRYLLLMAIAGALFLAMGLGVVVWFTHHLSCKVQHASRASKAMGDGLDHDFPLTGITELDAIGRSLEAVLVRQQEAHTALSQAETDPLTGLAGRGLFLRQAEALRLFGVERQMGVAFIFLDLDGFKQVNDTLGHEVGDSVLVEAAKRMRAAVRDNDMIGRLGGDEFGICAIAPPETIADIAQAIADRLIAEIGQVGHGVGGSIGIAVFGSAAIDLMHLIRVADEAMYVAKRDGKGRSVLRVYDPSLFS